VCEFVVILWETWFSKRTIYYDTSNTVWHCRCYRYL